MDGIGQGVSDPLCIMYQKVDPAQVSWTQVGQTEQLKDNLNPDFHKSFLVGYYFEKHQPIKFDVMDGDNSGNQLEMIGSI